VLGQQALKIIILEQKLTVAKEALERIASCEKRADGDVVDISREALASIQEHPE
jgi:hypothetical protein